ncbi:MAG: lytic transglycosylase domain-containing protein [Christensenellales bacterium]|jgi:soluble lytic murein transglycosylase-like protein
MFNVESIYLSKLEKFQTAAQESAAKLGSSPGVFADLLNAIGERLEPNQVAKPAEHLSAAISARSYGPFDWTYRASRTEIESAIHSAARGTGLDEDLIRAVIRAESSFRTDAVSSRGAMGLMQLMPQTAKEMGVSDPFDARQSVLGGAGYLKKLINRFGDIRLALAAYNTGQGRISSLGIDDANDPQQYERISPSVRAYVDRVLGYWEDYKEARY